MFDVKNIKRYYRLGLRKIRTFLLSDKCRECLVFLFFVLVSFCFWMLQTLDESYQTEFKVPLRLKNVPKEVVLTSDFPSEVRIRVEDRGTVFSLSLSTLMITRMKVRMCIFHRLT